MKIQKIQLQELLDYEQPTKYIVSSTNYSQDKTLTPVLTAGKTFILGYTNEKNGIFPENKLPVIIFDDFTTATKFVNFQFKVKSSAMKILHINTDKADPSYLFYLLQSIDFTVKKHKRHWISEYSQIIVDLPSIPEQKIIAKNLDKTISMINSKSEDIVNLLLEQKTLFANLRLSVLRKTFRLQNE